MALEQHAKQESQGGIVIYYQDFQHKWRQYPASTHDRCRLLVVPGRAVVNLGYLGNACGLCVMGNRKAPYLSTAGPSRNLSYECFFSFRIGLSQKWRTGANCSFVAPKFIVSCQRSRPR